MDMVRALFEEYAASLDFDLCFQDFEDELAKLPGTYGPPEGCLFVAFQGDKSVGCIGLRKLEHDVCEMKRLFVKPDYRGQGIGKALAEAAICEARKLGYRSMRLDTMPSMKEAIALYESLGFERIDPYRYNPSQHAVMMQLTFGR